MEANMTWSEDSWVIHNDSLTINNATHPDNSGSRDMSNMNLTIATLDFFLVTVTISSLDCLGIMGNLYSIMVWHTDKAFNATQFLFKYLAVWDIVYLGLDLAYNNIKRSIEAQQPWWLLIIYYGNNFVQLVSVHVTLLITVSRWIAVTFPLHAPRLLPARRIFLSCLLLVFYCAVLEATQLVYDRFYTHTTIFVIKVVVGLVLPLLLLLCFNISLLWNAFRRPGELQMSETHSASQNQTSTTCICPSKNSNTSSVSLERNVPATTTPSSRGHNGNGPNTGEETKQKPPEKHKHHKQEQQQQQQNTNAKTWDCHQTQSQRSLKQKMVKAVLLVSVCSFIAYPLGTSARIYALEQHEVQELTRRIPTYVAHMCQVINSSINVLIYWFFVSKFRQLAKDLRRRLSVRCGCAGGRDATSH